MPAIGPGEQQGQSQLGSSTTLQPGARQTSATITAGQLQNATHRRTTRQSYRNTPVLQDAVPGCTVCVVMGNHILGRYAHALTGGSTTVEIHLSMSREVSKI